MSFGIDDAVAAVASIGGKLIDRLWPDPAQAAAAKIELLKMQQTGELAKLTAETDIMKGQLAVDQAEAASADPFTSRARPFILWVCGAALAWTFILVPLGMWIGFIVGHPVPKPPTLDDHLWELMSMMLGMGGWHAYENVQAAKAGAK